MRLAVVVAGDRRAQSNDLRNVLPDLDHSGWAAKAIGFYTGGLALAREAGSRSAEERAS